MEIRWSPPAVEDLENIRSYIERDDSDAAQRVAQAIYEGRSRLGDFPHLGRASQRKPGRRELPFPPLPYLALYRINKSG